MLRGALRRDLASAVASNIWFRPTCLHSSAYSSTAMNRTNADIKQAIMNSVKASMRSGDKATTVVLKSVLADLTYMEKSPQSKDVSAFAVVRRGINRREESIASFRAGGRNDLADIEESEIRILNGLLPKQMSEDDISQLVLQVKDRLGANGLGDLGKVMKVLNTEVDSSVAPMKLVSEVAKRVLSS
ncbi:hypothetical protein BASA50_010554 [Batrachochytrium salamandrivorans]|uniref:Altered inheritance of mitochondria protein 41 n=1 Tax=Batrachochytrium salamandrivorans TaxID=1357716 RepID=A0ABQ8EY75_9FUNG|nr:hypothetical protein BASA61_009519 [Batrachochytrium salamandrivorans]KAH6588684.1 hypothetical protein BASA50_010554 [Batrachochytrium salamandrivorans]KAH9247461.1 hypothetical protein BASA81_014944 [Batrachochytrium salamandrivorans]